MQKTIFGMLCTILFLTIIAACSTKNEQATDEAPTSEADAGDEETWPMMDEFHMVMAESFHPFKDSANLEPVKANAVVMAEIANRWIDEPLPDKVNNDAVKTALQDLKSQAEVLMENVNTNDTNRIGESLTDLHNTFHILQDAWYDAGNDEHEEHH